jgi:hypothetical protein
MFAPVLSDRRKSKGAGKRNPPAGGSPSGEPHVLGQQATLRNDSIKPRWEHLNFAIRYSLYLCLYAARYTLYAIRYTPYASRITKYAKQTQL